MYRNKFLVSLTIVLTYIFSLNYFEYNIILNEYRFFKLLRYLWLLGLVLVSLGNFVKGSYSFIGPIKLIVWSILFSFLSALLFWGQSVTHSFLSTLPYLVFVSFFYLLAVRYPVDKLERIIILFGVIYVVLYFYQLSILPTVIFSFSETLSETRGIARIVFPGGGVFFLSIFIALVRIRERARFRIFWVSLAVLGVLIPILQVTRQYIMAVGIIYFIHFTSNTRLIYKFLIVVVFVTIAFNVITSENVLIQGMLTELENNVGEGQDYVRIQSARFYLNEFSKNSFTALFGNGVPYGAHSQYGKYLTHIRESRGFHFNDVGLIGFYAFFGVFAVFAYLKIFYYSITKEIDSRYYYLKYYLWFLFFTSFTSSTAMNYHFIFTNVLVIYGYHSVSYRLEKTSN